MLNPFLALVCPSSKLSGEIWAEIVGVICRRHVGIWNTIVCVYLPVRCIREGIVHVVAVSDSVEGWKRGTVRDSYTDGFETVDFFPPAYRLAAYALKYKNWGETTVQTPEP